MNEAQVVAWLGLPEGTRLRRCVVDGMDGVPVPGEGPDDLHIAVFGSFLETVSDPGQCKHHLPLVIRSADKVSQDEADYRPSEGNPLEYCGTCIMFQPPPVPPYSGSCTKVKGDIDARYVCRFFEPI